MLDTLTPLVPQRRDMIGQCLGLAELAAANPIGPDKVRIAEPAHRRLPVDLASRPQIAPGKPQEHRPRARLHPLALQRQEGFLDRVGHTNAPA